MPGSLRSSRVEPNAWLVVSGGRGIFVECQKYIIKEKQRMAGRFVKGRWQVREKEQVQSLVRRVPAEPR